MLSAAAIAAALTTRWLGRTLEYYPELGSTNVRLAELAAAGAPAGTLVITDHQTAGRGRLGRGQTFGPRRFGVDQKRQRQNSDQRQNAEARSGFMRSMSTQAFQQIIPRHE